jgi:hypothetical protein
MDSSSLIINPIIPQFRCRKYNVKLTIYSEHNGCKYFVDSKGKSHICIKFNYGKQIICKYLIT